MNLLVFLIIIATVVNGMLAGVNVEGSLVKLPARRRIGAVAYATFARGNDLGNGLVVYATWAQSASLLTLLATVVAYAEHQPFSLLLPLSIAALLTLGRYYATSKAAPVMLSLRKTPDDEAILAAKLDKFERWSAVRTTCMGLIFLTLMWALLIAH
ncbi:MAG: hypothetical protein JOZ18_13680 [Chloroflexi bacterium]|nr:hypothetical protein [Chloroflexota bacterium]